LAIWNRSVSAAKHLPLTRGTRVQDAACDAIWEIPTATLLVWILVLLDEFALESVEASDLPGTFSSVQVTQGSSQRSYSLRKRLDCCGFGPGRRASTRGRVRGLSREGVPWLLLKRGFERHCGLADEAVWRLYAKFLTSVGLWSLMHGEIEKAAKV
jgi:hypothetical protein